MEFGRNFSFAVLGILILVIMLTAFSSSQVVSGYVIGIPSSCTASFSLDAPDTITLSPGETHSYDVTIYDMKCGLSYIRLELLGLSEDWYDIAPSYIGVIAPIQGAKKFVVYIDIPLGTNTKVYSTEYRIYSNEGTYTKGMTEFDISEPVKPASQGTIYREGTRATSTPKAPVSENTKFWYAVAIVASVLAFIVLGSSYFANLEEQGDALKQRTGAELAEVIGTEPSKKKSLEKALKKKK